MNKNKTKSIPCLLYQDNEEQTHEEIKNINSKNLNEAIDDIDIEKINTWIEEQDNIIKLHQKKFNEAINEEHQHLFGEEQNLYRSMGNPYKIKKIFNQLSLHTAKSVEYQTPYFFLYAINQPHLAKKFLKTSEANNIKSLDSTNSSKRDGDIFALGILYDNIEIIKDIEKKSLRCIKNKKDNDNSLFYHGFSDVFTNAEIVIRNFTTSLKPTNIFYPKITIDYFKEQAQNNSAAKKTITKTIFGRLLISLAIKNKDWKTVKDFMILNYYNDKVNDYYIHENDGSLTNDAFFETIKFFIDTHQEKHIIEVYENLNIKYKKSNPVASFIDDYAAIIHKNFHTHGLEREKKYIDTINNILNNEKIRNEYFNFVINNFSNDKIIKNKNIHLFYLHQYNYIENYSQHKEIMQNFLKETKDSMENGQDIFLNMALMTKLVDKNPERFRQMNNELKITETFYNYKDFYNDIIEFTNHIMKNQMNSINDIKKHKRRL